MNKRTHGLLALATVTYACSAVIASAPGHAQDVAPAGEPLCSVDVATPIDPAVQSTSEVFVVPAKQGKVNLELRTDAKSETGYYQNFTVAPKNLATGAESQSEISDTVQGPDNVLTSYVSLHPGTYDLTFTVRNGSQGQPITENTCTAQYTVPPR